MLGTRVEPDEASVCESLVSSAGKMEGDVAFVRVRFDSGSAESLLSGELLRRLEESSGEALRFGAGEASVCDGGACTRASVSGLGVFGFQGLRMGSFSSRHHRRMRVAVFAVVVFTFVKP